MSLSKLFNFRYLFQNIKKSKMTIALFFIIVPVFTSLIIMANSGYVFEFEELAAVNIVGMYIIPFIFSICLFGYVFKKNSVDFMGSMPISRKTVFITNTIGGIGLIILLQVVTFFLSLLISSLTKGIIFTSMAWDILIYQTIAYIFVFITANLAMSVSGNLITQIAVTMLIIFIVPFSTWYVNNISGIVRDNYTLINGDIELMKVSKIENYTAPFFIMNEGRYYFAINSMWKMILLSVLYFVVGLILFDKRKMEVAGESFENKYSHLIVKGLTLIPFVAILKAFSYRFAEFTLILIVLAIIVVYYIIFDLITSKKIKIFENVIAIVVSIATIYGGYSIAIAINENMNKKLNINSIKSVSITDNSHLYVTIDDKAKVKEILTLLSKTSNNYYNEKRFYIRVNLNQNNGTKYEQAVYLSSKELSEILDNSYRNQLIGENAVISDAQIKLTAKERTDILKSINESLKNISPAELLAIDSTVSYLNIPVSEYRNHEFIKTNIPSNLNENVGIIIAAAYNRYAVDCLKNGYNRNNYMIDSFDKFDEETRQKVWFVAERFGSDIFSKFILENQDRVPEDIRKCIKISTYKFSFYTDRIDALLEIINKTCDDNREEFEEYMSTYYDKDVYYDSITPKQYEINIDYPNESGETLQSKKSGDTI